MNLKTLDLWTLDSGLEATKNRIQMSRFEDKFDDYSLDSPMAVKTLGNGIGHEVGGLKIHTPANADAAMWYYETPVVPFLVETFSVITAYNDVTSTAYMLMVKQGIGSPDFDGDVAVVEAVVLIGGDEIRLRRRKLDATYEYWNETTGAWQAGVISLPTSINYGHAYESQLIKGATGWAMRIKDMNTDTLVCDTTVATWPTYEDSYTNGDDYFLCGGDPVTTATFMQGFITNFRRSYTLTTLTATHGEIAFNATFTGLPMQEDVATGAGLTWYYKIDGGLWVSAASVGALNTALVGTYCKTLDFKVEFDSDTYGDAQAAIELIGDHLGTGLTAQSFVL